MAKRRVRPRIKIMAAEWSLREYPSEKRPWSAETKVRRVKEAVLVALVGLFVVLPSTSVGQEEGSERPELPGGIYDKPYIKRAGRGVTVGGYMDHEFEWNEGGKNTFDQHRFIPFIYGQVSDRVRVTAEIEFEHGGLLKGGGASDGEIKLEYAVMDFEFTESFNYRGGVILSPLGVFNLLHDSPLNDLTNRPTVNRQIMPSTLSESGMGFYGTFYPSELSVASYEIYVVNGVQREGDQQLWRPSRSEWARQSEERQQQE